MSKIKSIYRKKSKSWKDIYDSLISIRGDEKHSEAGRIFEVFAKHYYEVLPEVKEVYFLEETPVKYLQELGLDNKDFGVDLVIIDKRMRKIAVQVKFRKNEEREIRYGKDKLSNTSGHNSFDAHWFFSNSMGICDRTKRLGKNVEQVFIQDLEDLNSSQIKKIISSIHNVKISKDDLKKPREHQSRAIKEVVKGLKESSRGKLILPCGTGKTLTSLWIKEKMKSKTTLVLVPSLALLRQFKNSWLQQARKEFDFFCVCSEKDVDRGTVSSRYELGRTGFGVTTDETEIREFIKLAKDNLVVFSTYQSLRKVSGAFQGNLFEFDLVICDEAHRTATRKDTAFAVVHDDKKIKAKKRLYMTATPRVLSRKLIKKDEGVTKYISDMNDSTVFGNELFRMSFKEAIDLKLLVDYKILAIGVTESEVRSLIKERKYILDENTTVEDIANLVALNKVIKNHKTTHALTFHSTINRAKSFKDRYKEFFPRSWVETITGKQKFRLRKKKLSEYESRKSGVLTNARCLTEGVDIPSIDCVYFCDTKNSKIDIVQACGRALRIDDTRRGSKVGYIVCPLYHPENTSSIEDFIENSRFDNIVSVLRAMSSHDARIEEEISKLIYGKGKRQVSKKEKSSVSIHSILQLDLKGLTEDLFKEVFIETIRKSIPSLRWRPFKDAHSYVKKQGLKSHKEWKKYCDGELSHLSPKPIDIPKSPKKVYHKDFSNWGEWLGSGNKSTHSYNFRSFKLARKFVHSLGLKSSNEWFRYIKGSFSNLPELPEDIPRSPADHYKNDWIGIPDWIGTNTSKTRHRSYTDAKKFVHKLKLKNEVEWNDYCKKKSKGVLIKPIDIPASPKKVYRDEYVSIGEWLGTGNVATKNRKYRSFNKAREFIHSLQLKTQKEWWEYCRNGINGLPDLPADIPKTPNKVYSSEWKNIPDWLGSGKTPRNVKYRDFEEAKLFVHKLKLKNREEWNSYCRGEFEELLPSLPNDIPRTPSWAYKGKFSNLGNWLGTNKVANRDKEFRSFKDARRFVHKLNLKSCKEWKLYCKNELCKLPVRDIPTSPDSTYSDEWKDWYDWLGTDKLAS